ncbi:hypothetical protein GDO81_000169 [Engystomops pustulosus]|uniref:Syntaxin-18 n=1 Tax=Engystomops pustulosus TaxID=76066 RepID=A0AAV7D1U7_ENGPU|nr:hypothetical protein GDO81_000169 [Engystomops pustulosus]
MTDSERDQIDQDAQTFMRTCSDAIQQLKTEACKETISPQVREHRLAVLDFIEDYLKRVCKLYSEQRAIRVKRMVDKKRLSRLEPEQVNKLKTSPSAETITLPNPEAKEEAKAVGEDTTERTVADTHRTSGFWDDGRGEDELSPEEIQMAYTGIITGWEKSSKLRLFILPSAELTICSAEAIIGIHLRPLLHVHSGSFPSVYLSI